MDSLFDAFQKAIAEPLAQEDADAFFEAAQQIATRTSQAMEFDQIVPEHLQVSKATWKRMKETKVLAVDIETSNDDKGSPLGRAISKWGLSFLADITFISVAFSDAHDDGVVIQCPMSEDERAFMETLFTRNDAMIVFHNGKFDVRGLVGRLGLPLPPRTWDTHAAAISMGVVDLSYTSLSEQCKAYEKVIDGDVDYRVDDPDSSDYGQSYKGMWTNWHKYSSIKASRGALDALPQEDVAWYVLEDSRLTWKLYKAQREWTKILKDHYGYDALEKLHKIDQQYTWVTYIWSSDGYYIDREHVQSLLKRIADERWELEIEFAQMGVGSLSTYEGKVRYFFDVCNVPRPDDKDPSVSFLFTQSGKYAFNKAAQRYYQESFPEETALYTYYQHLAKMETTFIGYLAHSELDDKGHSTIGMGTITGRSSAKDPNNMNVKVSLPEEVTSLGRETISARGCIIASPGNVLCEFDYSNAEKRAQALEAQDLRLATIFVEGRDLHSENAAIFMPEQWKHAHAMLEAAETEKDRTHWKGIIKGIRSKGKPLTFGLDYGMGAAKAARQMRIAIDEAKNMIDNFDVTFYKLAKWKRDTQLAAETNYHKMKDCPNPLFAHGYVTNMFGQRILIDDPYFDPTSEKMRDNWYKGANYIPQSAVAYIIKKVVWEVHWYLQKNAMNTRIQQQVHDSLIIDADPREIDQLALGITHIMQKAVPYELSTVGSLYVDWPADLDHADNAMKWGWRAKLDYPLPTHDREGKPIVIGYPIEQSRRELEAEYRENYGKKLQQRIEFLHQRMLEGPSGIEWFIYPNDDGQIEYRRWADMPDDLDELHQIADTLAHWKERRYIPPEWLDSQDRYVKFVDWVRSSLTKIEEEQDKLERWIDVHGDTA